MRERQGVWTALAATLVSLGGGVLIYKASGWTDPIFWVGTVAVTVGALIFLLLLVPSWLTDRQVRQARSEQVLREGRANQRQGLDEIVRELGQVSSQLKGELRWGKRGPLFPNSAWRKNQGLVRADVRPSLESVYERAHLLDEETLSAEQAELDERETQERQQLKQAVDSAVEVIRDLSDEVQP